jgi:hypothetical protein
MKLFSFNCLKKQGPWFFPIVLTAGIIIGFASIVLVSQFLPAKKFIAQQNNQNQQLPTTSSTTNEEVDVNQLTTSTVDLPATVSAAAMHWETPTKIARKEYFDLLSGITNDKSGLWSLLQVTSTDGLGGDAPEFVGMSSIWKLGTVQSGPWKDGTVYALDVFANYPERGAHEFVLSADKAKMALVGCGTLDDGTYYMPISLLQAQVERTPVCLNGINPLKKLHVNGRTFELTDRPVNQMQFNYELNQYAYLALSDKPIVVTDEGVSLYTAKENSFGMGMGGCLASVLPDGSVVNYAVFLPEKGTAKDEYGRTYPTYDIQWTNGFVNTNTYVGLVFAGCGGGYCPNMASSTLVGSEDHLIVVGTEKTTGDKLYAPKDPVNHPLVKQTYEMWYDPSFTKKPSIQDMIVTYKVPIFFWKDPMGRWIQYGVSGLVPQAECGKPVIYLYPQTTTNVTVKLPKFIHVTVSDPLYPANGWNVTASSSGMLISRDDGKVYDSLYWEGTGVNYQTPKTGFVVKGSDIASFLQTTLPRYGLNPKETADFMDFWVPKIQSVPYARISFLTDAWSQAAPLSVSPRPQTSIRIFMDWKPLSAPISIKAPSIVTPIRNGFTLVEWGGTLYPPSSKALRGIGK